MLPSDDLGRNNDLLWAALDNPRIASDTNRLELDSVSMIFGGVGAVDGLTMRVDESEVHGLIGPNGAGKTTFFNLVSGFLGHDFSSVRLE